MKNGASISESVEVRVPAKAILAGEHFVLYGVRAVAAPVEDIGLTLRVASRPGSKLVLPEPLNQLSEAVSTVLNHRLNGFIRLWSTSDIPQGAGLGSSAAFAVALGRALVLMSNGSGESYAAQKGPLEDHKSEQNAMEIAQILEGEIHGKASGIDTAAVSNRGAIIYSMDDGLVESLHVETPFRFLLIDTGERRSTREQIEHVAGHRQREPEFFEEKASLAQSHVESFIHGMSLGDKGRVQDSMDALGTLLASLGLESAETTALRQDLKSRGLALKVTGAGGGGFLLGFTEDGQLYDELLASEGVAGRAFAFTVPRFNKDGGYLSGGTG